jgi:hypothetical protein
MGKKVLEQFQGLLTFWNRKKNFKRFTISLCSLRAYTSGAASVLLSTNKTSIAFSGDLGQPS